jgi:predicted Zn-dependent peptidase
MSRITAAFAAVLAGQMALAQDIPVEKYKLDNGLTVILRVDHTLPVCAINTWYHVGAKDEQPGRSGFAHLYEHLMFMGTERVPNGQFDAIMEAKGGANNASTSFDRTNYYSAGPASLLPTLLWLDADRLEDLARAMDTAKLDRQRDVVRNEIRQQVENRPYGKAEEYIFRLMYPKGHPYHEAVYGTHEDLEAANVWNVKDFFATFYVPNNASLVVAGDFDPERIKPLVAQLFGTLPRGAEVNHRTAEPVKLDRVIRTTMIDKVQLPLVKMVWHSPAAFADGDAEADLIGALLSQGKNSRLYKRLVFDDKTCVDVSAQQEGAGLGSLFIIDATAKPDADLNAIEKAIDEEVARLSSQPIDASELEQRKASTELGKLAQLQSVAAVADKLNEYEFNWGEPNSFKRDLDRYRNASPIKVQWWAKKILDPAARAIVRVLPEQPERAPSARDQRPEDLSPATFTPPAPQTFTLSNGVPVMLWRKPELPLVGVSWLFRAPGPIDAPARAGLAPLAAQMTEEGAGSLNALEFAAALQALGATYDAGAGMESASAHMTVLKRNFEKATGLLADALRRPRLEAADWDRVKSLELEELRQQDDEPTIVAGRVGLRALFGDDNPFGWPEDGTVKTVGAFTLDDIKAEEKAVFRPEGATLLVAGDITAEEARPILEKAFGDWKSSGPGPAPSTVTAPASHDGLRVLIVDRPDAVQTVIRYVLPGVVFKNDGRVALRMLNTVFGGGFTSRLNQNIREQHGYAYGAGSRFVMEPSAGYFIASASVKADVTGPALKEFIKEFDRLKTGDISDDEAGKARETLRTELVQAFQGLSGLLGEAGETVLNGVPYDTLGKDAAAMGGVKGADLNGAAKSGVRVDQGVLVLVGDKKLILDQIKDLGLPTPTEVGADGTPKN